jgi:CHAT domain-containing protein
MKFKNVCLFIFLIFAAVSALLVFKHQKTSSCSFKTNLQDHFVSKTLDSSRLDAADELRNSGHFLAAANAFEAILKQSNLNSSDRIYLLNQSVFCCLLAHKEQKALPFIQDLERLNPNIDTNSTSAAADYCLNKGLYYSYLYQPKEALHYLQKASVLLQKYYGEKHLKVATCLTHIGLVQYDFDRVADSAFVNILKGYNIFQENSLLKPFSAEAELGMVYLAISTRSKEVAKQHHNIVIEHLQQGPEQDSVMWMKTILVSLHSGINKSHAFINIPDEKIAQILPTTHILMERYQVMKLLNYWEGSEASFIKEVENTATKIGTSNNVFFNTNFLFRHYYFGHNEFKKVIEHLDNKETQNNKPTLRLFLQETQYVVSNSYKKLKQYDKSIEFYLSEENSNDLLSFLIKPKAQQDRYYAVSCGFLGDILYEKFKSTKKIADGLLAHQAYLSTDENFFSGIKTIDDDAILRYQAEVGSGSFSNAVEVCASLYSMTHRRQYLDDAFRFSDRMKSFLLFRSHKNQDQNNPILIEIQQIEAQTNTLKMALSKQNINDYTSISVQLNKKMSILGGLYKKLESDFPELYNVRVKQPIPSITKVQQTIDSETALLEYGLEDKHLSIMYVDKDTCILYISDTLSNVSNSILALKTILARPNYNVQEFEQFKTLSHSVYASLLKPVEAFLCKKKNIVVIPDKGIAQFPFDVLTTQKNDKALTYKDLDYCIKHYQFSYSPSWKIYEYGNQVEIAPNATITTFTYGSKQQLGVLPCAVREVAEIKAIFSPKYVHTNSGSGCTKTVFEQQHNSADILHLSLHANSNTKNKLDNKIYFQLPLSDTLFGYELLKYNFQNKMIVLSACETNIGQIKAGEGAYSLSRYFLQVGVPYIVSSLWKINDCTNSDVMISFYSNIHQGMKPKVALYEAKCSFLRHADNITASPSIWAGMVFME